jgi:hypothetical protein
MIIQPLNILTGLIKEQVIRKGFYSEEERQIGPKQKACGVRLLWCEGMIRRHKPQSLFSNFSMFAIFRILL